MESRKLLSNASYFAFTATPKNKTLEIFGEPEPQPDGSVRHRAFHRYTMKQAIQEGFILDVLTHYTPVTSYYKLAKTIEDDPEFDASKAQKKLRRFFERHDHAIRLKAEIMVDHFHDQILARNRVGGEERAIVIVNGIERGIQYFHAIRAYLAERKSPHRAIVAFSGEYEFGGAKVTEASLNGFPASRIALLPCCPAAGCPLKLSDRMFIEAVLYQARTGIPWRDLLDEFGDWTGVYRRFRGWENRHLRERHWRVESRSMPSRLRRREPVRSERHRHPADRRTGTLPVCVPRRVTVGGGRRRLPPCVAPRKSQLILPGP